MKLSDNPDYNTTDFTIFIIPRELWCRFNTLHRQYLKMVLQCLLTNMLKQWIFSWGSSNVCDCSLAFCQLTYQEVHVLCHDGLCYLSAHAAPFHPLSCVAFLAAIQVSACRRIQKVHPKFTVVRQHGQQTGSHKDRILPLSFNCIPCNKTRVFYAIF